MSDAERPDWSSLLPWIRAGREVLAAPSEASVAETNLAKILGGVPVDFDGEVALHAFLVGASIASQMDPHALILSLIPLVPEDVGR